MTARVLVVDDDDDIREMLLSTLRYSGYDAVGAVDGTAALRELDRAEPDLVLLDVMMPGLDGFELVQLLRHRHAVLPVLFLSARDAVEDRVRGLRLGADDYVTKPFSTVEVLARADALLRRRSRPDASAVPLVAGPIELDPERHRVLSAGEEVLLSPTEFRLLQLLIENRGRVLSKGQILERVWQYDFGGDGNVVERFISNLRRKLRDDPAEPVIETVRGFGYRARDVRG